LTLFAICDAIGSYYERASDFTIPLDGRRVGIGGEHFRILNGPHYGLDLTSSLIKFLTEHFRNPLAHHALIGRNCVLYKNHPESRPFFVAELEGDKVQVAVVNLVPFLDVSKQAAAAFLTDVDSIISNSRNEAYLRAKADYGEMRAVELQPKATSVITIQANCVTGFFTSESLASSIDRATLEFPDDN